jgi:hypothetical protein
MRARQGLAPAVTRESAPESNPVSSRRYSPAERVFHPKFGEGVIVDAVDRRDDQELAIEFARHGRKRFLASLTPLDVIPEPAGRGSG